MDKRAKRIVIVMWVVCGLGAAALGGMVWIMRSSGGSPPVSVSAESSNTLPVLFAAPAFSLTDQNGKAFDNTQLHGKVWVADFIFTHCAGICPMMTQRMKEFQNQTAGSPVQIVSFSVDPSNDTPAALKDYAAAAKADESRWHFLTGESREKLWDICRGMKLAVGPDTNNQVMHSDHFLLIDGDGNVRGVYGTNEAGFLTKLVADAKDLAGQRS